MVESTGFGANLKSDYVLEKTIGKGSFATVRKGKSKATGQAVAIKTL